MKKGPVETAVVFWHVANRPKADVFCYLPPDRHHCIYQYIRFMN